VTRLNPSVPLKPWTQTFRQAAETTPKYEPCHSTNNYATISGNKDIANNHPFHPYYKPFPMGNADRRRRKNNKKLHIRGESFVERGAISANWNLMLVIITG
jgi:hypothetical protein